MPIDLFKNPPKDLLAPQVAPAPVKSFALDNPQVKQPFTLGKTFSQSIAPVLPAAGAALGGFAGGAVGGLISSPSILGIPAGVYGGAVAGSALGGATGEAIKEKLQGSVSLPTVAKTGAEFGALEAVGGPLMSVAGKAVKSAGEGIAKMFIPKSDIEAGMLQTYKAGVPFLERVKGVLGFGKATAPSTAGSAAFDKGLMGTESQIGVQAKRAQSSLWNNLIQPALKQSNTKVDMSNFLTEAEQKITTNTPDPTRRKVLLNALEAVKEDFAGTGKITMEELQKFKEGWAEFVPERAYKGQPIAGALNDVRNQLASQAREKIYGELGGEVRQAYLDYGNLHSITALGRKAMTGAIKGGTGTSLKNLWEMATVPVGTIGGQTVYKVGQGLEFLGTPGARILRDVLGVPLGQKDKSTSESTPPVSK